MSVFNCSTCGLTLQYGAVDNVADFERYLAAWATRHCLQCRKPARENRWSLPDAAECGPALARLLDLRPMTDAEAERYLTSREDIRLRLQRLKGHYGDDRVFVAAAKMLLDGEPDWMDALRLRSPRSAARARRWLARFRHFG